MAGFVKLNRNLQPIETLIKRNKNAFILLTIIALRARRTDDLAFDNLGLGQALVGDYNSYGMSRQEYRSAIGLLKSNHLITIDTTSKGTIATIVNKDIYDINEQPTNHQTTNNQPSNNQQPTTNNNEKIKEFIPPIIPPTGGISESDKPNQSKRTVGKIDYDFETQKFSGLNGDVEKWKEAYPAVDVDGEIKRAAIWLRNNPTKRKKNYGKFLTSWLSRQQEKGGSFGGFRTQNSTFTPADDEKDYSL